MTSLTAIAIRCTFPQVTEPVRIDERDAIALHGWLLALHGGAVGLRNDGLLKSALARPKQHFAYGESPDIVDMATAYTAGIVRNHPLDGNKRTQASSWESYFSNLTATASPPARKMRRRPSWRWRPGRSMSKASALFFTPRWSGEKAPLIVAGYPI
jgi:hypothetical protein